MFKKKIISSFPRIFIHPVVGELLFAAQLVFEKEMSGIFLYVRITYTTGNSLSSSELALIFRVGEKPQLI